MNWNTLSSVEQLEEIKKASYQQPQLIFKHSTRCSISSMILNRLERSEKPGQIRFHYLDLITYRSLSNQLAEDFSVYHESPQVLLIKNGECIYDESHQGINMDEITEQAAL